MSLNKERIVKVIYQESIDHFLMVNNIREYLDKEGVWALFGKKEKTEPYICLNVGKCTNVGKEILYDISCLHNLSFIDDGNRA